MRFSKKLQVIWFVGDDINFNFLASNILIRIPKRKVAPPPEALRGWGGVECILKRKKNDLMPRFNLIITFIYFVS